MTTSNKINIVIPQNLKNQFRDHVNYLISDWVEELEARHDNLDSEEMELLRSLQSIKSTQARYAALSAALGETLIK